MSERSHRQEETILTRAATWGPIDTIGRRQRMRRTIEVNDHSGCFDIFQTPDLVVLLVTYGASTRSNLPGQERLHRQALLSTTRQERCRLLCRSYKGRVIESGMSNSVILIDHREDDGPSAVEILISTRVYWRGFLYLWNIITVARLPILNTIRKITS